MTPGPGSVIQLTLKVSTSNSLKVNQTDRTPSDFERSELKPKTIRYLLNQDKSTTELHVNHFTKGSNEEIVAVSRYIHACIYLNNQDQHTPKNCWGKLIQVQSPKPSEIGQALITIQGQVTDLRQTECWICRVKPSINMRWVHNISRRVCCRVSSISDLWMQHMWGSPLQKHKQQFHRHQLTITHKE